MKFFKLKRRHVCLRENALFWVFLALLSIGCMAKLYEQASLAPASSESVFASSQAAGGRDCLCPWDRTAKNTPSEIAGNPGNIQSKTEGVQ